MKFTRTVQVHIEATQTLTATSTLYYFPEDMSQYGYTCIGAAQVVFEVTPAAVVNAQVHSITQEINRVQQVSAAKVDDLEAALNNLLCLEA